MRPSQAARHTYWFDGRLYVNLTSRCDLACRFCFKFQKRSDFFGIPLLMTPDQEPSVESVAAEIAAAGPFAELVFCGLGEPLQRHEDVLALAKRFHREGADAVPIRINTDGLFLLHGTREELVELARVVDSLSISLNGPDQETYNRICRPRDPARSFPSLLEFIRTARDLFRHVQLTVVALPEIDLDACRRLAAELGVPLAVRAFDPGPADHPPDEVAAPALSRPPPARQGR